jgi:potassium efflux system protein
VKEERQPGQPSHGGATGVATAERTRIDAHRMAIMLNAYRLLLTLALTCAPILLGQAIAQTTEGLSRSQIEARLGLVTSSSEIPQETVDAAASNYRAALERLTAAADSRSSAEAMTASAAGADSRLADLKRERDDASSAMANVEKGLSRIDAAEARDLMVEENTDQLRLRERKDALDRQLAGRLGRPIQLRDEISAISERIEELNSQIEALEGAANEPEMSEQLLLKARLEAALADRERARTALSTLPARLEVLEQELQLVNARRALNERQINILAGKIAEDRLSASTRASRAAREIRELAETLPRPIDADVIDVADLLQELSGVLTEIGRLTREVAADRADREQLARDFEAIRSRVEVAGAQAALGQLLQSQRLRIPDVRKLRQELADTRALSADAGLRSLELVDLRREHQAWVESVEAHLDALENELAARAAAQTALPSPKPAESPEDGAQAIPPPDADAAPASPPLDIARVSNDVLMIADQRREVLGSLSASYDQYVTLLADDASEKQAMRNLAVRYGDYLNDRLLWVPSAEPIDGENVLDIAGAFLWLASPGHWAVALEVLQYELRTNAPWYLFGALIVALGLRSRRGLRAFIAELGARTRKVRTDRFSLTVEALIYTALLALFAPAILIALGLRWQLLPLPDQARAVAMALPFIGVALASTGFMRQLCMPDGVGRLHLHWSPTRLKLWPRTARLVLWVWLPLITVSNVANAQTDTDIKQSLGRIAFAASSVALAYILAELMHPKRGLPSHHLETHPESWAARLIRVWYPALILVPVALAIEALAGYEYAADLLLSCVEETVLLLVGGMLLFDLLGRWIRVTRRRYRYAELVARRSATGRETAADDGTGDADAAPAPAEREQTVEFEDIDIDDFDEQTRRLVSTVVVLLLVFGCWLIWSKALPVLGVLDRVSLWQQNITQGEQVVVSAVTAGDLVLALVTLFMVLLATRTLPGLLEFAVLKNLPLDAGSRYAIRTVSQYLLVITGTLVAMSQIGLAWNQVQWLVAALSVGLGFGLQEIFANFVSGLIILLERPVRVGDTVTVGDISGSVTRIRIRATTITDWDNKEVIVPNKTFITGQLVNWTLSNEITRVVVPVGIAYGSDTELAIRTMMETAQRNSLVLSDPAPRVLFKAFGDSSLNFDVFIYCRHLGDRLAARHQLLVEMERALADAGVTIPFPQRDLHIYDHREGATTPAEPGVIPAIATRQPG